YLDDPDFEGPAIASSVPQINVEMADNGGGMQNASEPQYARDKRLSQLKNKAVHRSFLFQVKNSGQLEFNSRNSFRPAAGAAGNGGSRFESFLAPEQQDIDPDSPQPPEDVVKPYLSPQAPVVNGDGGGRPRRADRNYRTSIIVSDDEDGELYPGYDLAYRIQRDGGDGDDESMQSLSESILRRLQDQHISIAPSLWTVNADMDDTSAPISLTTSSDDAGRLSRRPALPGGGGRQR
ncbi:hypothetical protein HK405_002995, partial [Cladochytrium tenue]